MNCHRSNLTLALFGIGKISTQSETHGPSPALVSLPSCARFLVVRWRNAHPCHHFPRKRGAKSRRQPQVSPPVTVKEVISDFIESVWHCCPSKTPIFLAKPLFHHLQRQFIETFFLLLTIKIRLINSSQFTLYYKNSSSSWLATVPPRRISPMLSPVRPLPSTRSQTSFCGGL